jgi:hypothetical protein
MQAPRCRPRGWPKRCLIPMVRSGARLALKEARKGRTHAVAARLHSIAWTPSLLPGCQRTSIGRGRPAMTPRLRPFRSPPDLETGARARFPLVEALRVSGASIAIRLSRAAANDQCDLSDRPRAETLQFESGGGSHWETIRTGVPVPCPCLLTSRHRSWPMSLASRASSALTPFRVPMKLGAATVGTVD